MTTWYLSTNANAYNLQQLIDVAASGDTIKITPYGASGTFVAASDTMSISTSYLWQQNLAYYGYQTTLGVTPIVIYKNLTIDGDWNNDGVADLTFTATGGGPAMMIAPGVTVTLNGVKFANSSVSTPNGADAYNYGVNGGDALNAVSAIYNAGTLTLQDVDFVNNTATAGRGGYGGNGFYTYDPAPSGASGEQIEGSYGANGSNGANSPFPGGAGGRGGDAATVYNVGTINESDLTFTGNVATPGNGGGAGNGGRGQDGGRGGDGEDGSGFHDGGNAGNSSAQILGGSVNQTNGYTASGNTANYAYGGAGGYGGGAGSGGSGGAGGGRGYVGTSSGASGDRGTDGHQGAGGARGADGYAVNNGGNNTVGLYVDTNTQYESSANTTKTVTFWVTRSGDLNVAQDVTLNFNYGTGLNAADFSGTAPGTQTVHFAAGEQQKTYTYTLANDGVTEGTETLTASLSSPGSGLDINSSPQQVVTIRDTYTYSGLEINNPYSSPIIQFVLPSGVSANSTAIVQSSTATSGVYIALYSAGGVAQITLPQYYYGSFEFTYRVYNSNPYAFGSAGIDYHDYSAVVNIAHRNVIPTTSYQSGTTAEDTPYSFHLTASDVETSASQLTYELLTLPSHGAIQLNSDGTFVYTPSADYSGSDSFQWKVTDTEGGWTYTSFYLTVTAVNDAPVAATAAESAYGYRDTPITGTLLAGSDIDSTTLTYHVVADSAQHGSVTIDPDTRAFVFTPDASFYGTASFQYAVNDGVLDSEPKTVTVNVNAPATISGATAGQVTEAGGTANGAAGTPTVSGTLHAADLDDPVDTFIAVTTATASQNGYGTFTMTADGTWTYTLDNTNPTVEALKADRTLSDSFTVYSIDGTPQVVTIAIGGANDAPVAHDANARGDEDTAIHGTVTADDIDRPVDILAFRLVDENGGAQHGTVTIDPATGTFVYIPAHDYYGTDSFSVRVNDGTDDSNIATVSVIVDPVNDPAVVTTTTPIEVAENTTVVAALTSTDVDGPQAGTFTITGGADAALFDIAGGNLVFRAPHDYETEAHSYQVEVTAFDGADNTPKMLTVTLTNTNDNAPVFVAGTSVNLGETENTAASTVIWTAGATDADGTAAANTIVYSLSGDDAALFSIDAATGAVRFLAAPDYEAPADHDGDNRYLLTVHANDGLHDVTQDVAVAVSDVNDIAPIFAAHASIPSASVAENIATSTIVFTASASDADTSLPFNTVAYSLTGDDAALFSIDASTGAIRFLTTPDHESPADHDGDNLYRLTMHANDGVHDVTDDVTIAVTDRNDNTPVFTSGTAASEPENTPASSVVYTADASDADSTAPNNTIAYSLSGDDAARFSIDAATGEVRFLKVPHYAAPLDADRDNLYQITVHANDGAHDVTQDAAISVTDVVPRPAEVAASVPFGPMTTAWQVAGIGDFNGDGTSDVLWLDAQSGQINEWQMRDGNWSHSIDLGARGAGWQIAGTGDFNGDGTDDILWRNETTGNLDAWIMKDGQWSGSVDLGARGTDWTVRGIGDFNGDGTGDILFQNSKTGAVDEWQMRAGNWSDSVSLGSHNTAWSSAAIGDFTGDGTDDVLWHNPTTGQVEEWRMKDGNWAGSVDLGSFNPAYDLAAVHDVDGDGSADVLWRNPSNGKVEGWLMNEDQWFASISLGASDPAWQFAGIGTFGSTGGTDVFWHNASTGQTGTWLLHQS